MYIFLYFLVARNGKKKFVEKKYFSKSFTVCKVNEK